MATYKYLNEIGSGGFGKVWKARRNEDGTEVAIKKLETKQADALKRFSREVRILSSLDHPNIIRVIGKRLESDSCFYVMPLYNGSLVGELPTIAKDESRISKIFGSMLNGIEYAHSQGVIHRDLKPENILLNNDDDLVISDFGLGRFFDSTSTRITQEGYGMGTPLYMAPEQLTDSKNADGRSDIYSLGRILYELYTGQLGSHWQDPDQLPPRIRLIVAKCTRHNPDQRYQTVSELKQVWNSIFEIKKTEAELSEFAMLMADSDLSPQRANRLIELFHKNAPSDDALHDAMMSTTADAIKAMYDIEPDVVRDLIERFAKFTSDHGWGWGYTDKIGNWCHRVFRIIDDCEIRCALIICTLVVGIGHNRWHVLAIFGKLIAEMKCADDVSVLIQKLQDVPRRYLVSAKGYLPATLFPELRDLFEKNE